MAISKIVKNRRDGTIYLLGGGGESFAVSFEEGDLKIDIPGYTIDCYLNRGEFSATPGEAPCLRKADAQPVTGTFSAYLRDITDAAYATLEEFVAGRTGAIAAWAPTNGALLTTDVPTLTVRWVIKGKVHGDGYDHYVECPWSWLSGGFEEGLPNKISVSFTSYCVYPVCRKVA